jgi:hypothetical protein
MYPPGPDPNSYYAPQSQQNRNPNPYAPPVSDAWNDPSLYAVPKPQGTYAGGFAVGFFFALIGLLIVYLVGKSETKRGALHGIGLRFGLVLLVALLAI